MIAAILDARRELLIERLEAIREMGMIDDSYAQLHAMIEELEVLRDIYLTLLYERTPA